jgi:hypothetical protein
MGARFAACGTASGVLLLTEREILSALAGLPPVALAVSPFLLASAAEGLHAAMSGLAVRRWVGLFNHCRGFALGDGKRGEEFGCSHN